MKNIIIFYQVINREIESCKMLKKELETKNDIKAFIFSIDFEHYKAVNLSKKQKIDMVIMPWMYQDSNYELVHPFIKRNPDVIIINLHHEQIGSEASDNVLLPTSDNAKNSVLHFVWGNFFKEKLLSVGVNEKFIFVTGNMRTDIVNKISRNRMDLAKEFSLDINKRWILFSENRGWVLTDNKRKEEHLVYLGFTKKDLRDRKLVNQQSLNQTIKEFNELPDDFFEKNELIYRPHPGTKAPENINNRVKVIYKYSIYDWINSVDVNVVWSSTTVFESDIKGVPSIVYEPIEHPSRYRTYGLDEYQKIHRFDEIDEKLIKYYKTKIAPKKIYERYIGKVDGKSVERSKDIIIKILNEGVEGYFAKEMSYSKKNDIKRYLFQKVTRVLVMTNLLEFFRYPRSAYELRNEIPYKKN